MTDLYRHYDKDDNLLYVGISLSTLQRLGQHKRNARWFDSITRIGIEKCSDRDEALRKEAYAIKTERPVYNIQHAVKVKEKKKVYKLDNLYECIRALSIEEGWEDDDMDLESPADIFDGVTISLRKLARFVNSTAGIVGEELRKLGREGKIKEINHGRGCSSYMIDVNRCGYARCKWYFDDGRTSAHLFAV